MDRRVETVARLMAEGLERELGLAELAARVNLSPHRLGHLFKTETGLSPTRYLKRLRMQKARELLETTFLSIKEIRLKVGVRDKGRFARDFRAAYGLTPVQYKARLTGRDATAADALPEAGTGRKDD